jgi:hypothetical protein
VINSAAAADYCAAVAASPLLCCRCCITNILLRSLHGHCCDAVAATTLLCCGRYIATRALQSLQKYVLLIKILDFVFMHTVEQVEQPSIYCVLLLT